MPLVNLGERRQPRGGVQAGAGTLATESFTAGRIVATLFHTNVTEGA